MPKKQAVTKDTEDTIKELRLFVAKIELLKDEIAAKRDKIRDMLSEVESLATDLDDADDLFTSGVEDIRYGVELISQTL